MKLMPQLTFVGQCREAFERYARVFGGTITAMTTFGSTDVPLPPGSQPGGPELIRFAQLDIGDQTLLGNDVSDADHEPMGGFNVSFHTHNVEEATRIFAALAEGGTVIAPLTEMPWARQFGQVRDRYGVPWLILALPE